MRPAGERQPDLRSDMKDFVPSCFHSASTGVGNAKDFGCGGWSWTLSNFSGFRWRHTVEDRPNAATH